MLRTMLLERKGEDWSTLLPTVMLYMNSMSQEKTGVSACEILFGNNPNLPSDISYTPVTSLSNDREGYVKQLKRDLQDIWQKLSRILGHNRDQSNNPFSVGDKVIIAILPHDNTNKLMAKWKGPFIVTKIPNRFQIEYFDGSVTRLTHISYAKRYNERCHYTGIPHPAQVSRRRTRARMARLRLILRSGRRKMRRIVSSMSTIQDKWPIHAGRVRVRILGEAKDLPADLRAIVEALDPDNCIEGNALVDLCRQRSDWRGSGCDVPRTSEELPVPSSSPPTSTPTPAVQVNQFSWRHNAKTDKCFHDKRREFVNSDKYSNHASFFPTQQAPLVSQAHLLSVVRKVEKGERFKGKKQPEFVVKNLSPSNREKLMTSLSLSRQKAGGENQQDSVYTNRRKSETDQIIPIYQCKTSMYSLKPSESRKEQKESQFKLPGLPNRHYAHDVMDDGINRDGRREIVNRLVARKRYAASKHSSSHVKEDLNSSLTISKQFLVQLAIIFIMVINLIRSGLNMNLLKLAWVVGLTVVVCQECVGTRCATTTADQPQTFPRYSFGGKRFNAYILPSTNVYASWMDYFDRYIRNLESEYRIMRFYKLIYLYICAFDPSWVSWGPATLSSKIATLASDILYTLVYLLLKWINSVIRIRDEYQSCFLVGLALTCKASSQIQCILLRF